MWYTTPAPIKKSDHRDAGNARWSGPGKECFPVQDNDTTTRASRPKTFNRKLSLAIELCHWQIDALSSSRGPWALLFRAWLYLRLRWLEGQIPRA